MIITTEMARALLLVVLVNHVEDFDQESWRHRGCSCGWNATGKDGLDWDDVKELGVPRSRRLWQEHLASVILGMKEK